MKRRTEKQRAASRSNGALSRGPISPMGKAISSSNAVTHGLSARNLHLAPDEQPLYDAHLELFLNHFQPVDAFHAHIVHQCATASFLLRRAEVIQSTLIDLEIDVRAPQVAHTFRAIDREGLLTIGFKSLNDHSTAFENIDRHSTRLANRYFRLLHLCNTLARSAQQPLEPTNEPG